MQPDSLRPRPPRRRQPRVPPFYPVPLRSRRDGWTAQRQSDFLGYLAETGSVMAAAEMVGMSRKGAYQLRAMPGAESFAAAWDAALWLPERKVTVADEEFLAHEGLICLRFFRGRYRGSHQVPDTSACMRLLRRSLASRKKIGGGREW
jgi:hypothetical protein